MNDEQIIDLFWARDEKAILETDRSYGSHCRSVSKRILNSAEDAEECVNDSYLRLWQQLPPEKPNSLGAFLTRIVRNLSIDRLRQLGSVKRGGSAITVSLDELEQVTGRGSVESSILADELGAAVDKFLRTQSQEARSIFLRRYYFFDTRTEIADRYEISVAQVSVVLSRTRKRLRNYLKEEGLL
ncbi:MAG: sigma-70 family RNA polymerase sigma factor [Oscillospiraceae bacterium]|nr:sigma-70 family RNA polymerase sigma factor [Oscillospiraceae bacterium]